MWLSGICDKKKNGFLFIYLIFQVRTGGSIVLGVHVEVSQRLRVHTSLVREPRAAAGVVVQPLHDRAPARLVLEAVAVDKADDAVLLRT